MNNETYKITESVEDLHDSTDLARILTIEFEGGVITHTFIFGKLDSTEIKKKDAKNNSSINK
jgi:major membrane immunogen (membrane-anchored lipoprotein)